MKANDIRSETQFSVFLVNKPGALARVCQLLAEKHINITAMSMMDSSEHGVLRMVVESPAAARAALASLEMPTAECQVLTVRLPNRPGALADVVQRLSAAHINVNYAYCTTGAPGNKSLGVFRVSDLNKAVSVLSERRPARRQASLPSRADGRIRRK